MNEICVECGKPCDNSIFHTGYGFICSIDPCYIV